VSHSETDAEEPQGTRGDEGPEGTEEADTSGDGTNRPAGTSEPNDYSGVDAKGPIDPDSPTLQPGG
jgi:hypothetical protein